MYVPATGFALAVFASMCSITAVNSGSVTVK